MRTTTANVGFVVWGTVLGNIMTHWGILRSFTAHEASA